VTDDSLYLQQRTGPLNDQSHPTPAQPSVLHLTNASPVLWTLQSINHVTTAAAEECITIRSMTSCKCSTTSTRTTRAGAKVILSSQTKQICAKCLSFLPVRCYASAGNRDRNVSVCSSVCHAPVLCQNEEN